MSSLYSFLRIPLCALFLTKNLQGFPNWYPLGRRKEISSDLFHTVNQLGRSGLSNFTKLSLCNSSSSFTIILTFHPYFLLISSYTHLSHLILQCWSLQSMHCLLCLPSALPSTAVVWSWCLLEWKNVCLAFGLLPLQTSKQSRQKLERQEEGKHTSKLRQYIVPPWKQWSNTAE